MWCVPEINQEFVDRMEDVLALYARPYKKAEPVVCLDERPVQLLDPARRGLPIQPGRPARTDYEYVREGTANVFCIVEPITGSRLTYASANRNGRSFARALWRIARRYRRTQRIHLILDNLSTHSQRCVVDALGAGPGRRLWRRFVVHYTPKHASWLNAAEMEASLVSRECIGGRRIGHLHTLKSQIASWRRRAERDHRPIRWKFTVSDARRVFRYDGIITPRTEH
jgi:transposase